MDEHGFKGLCCCNCKHQVKLMKHPWNKEFGKGSIMEQCGWVCVAQNGDEPKGEQVKVGFMDGEHSLCELHMPRTPKIIPPTPPPDRILKEGEQPEKPPSHK